MAKWQLYRANFLKIYRAYTVKYAVCAFLYPFLEKIREKGAKIMFILTDGKNFVMENPVKEGVYIATSTAVMAKEFTYKQARTILNNKCKKMSWIKNYYMVNKENGQAVEMSLSYKGKAGVYVGENDIKFDETIIAEIYQETETITGLAGWSINQIKTYREQLKIGLSKYDSAMSDIEHALQKYKKLKDGKKPQAHKAAKIGYLLEEVRSIRENIKQCLDYIQVFENAIINNYTIEKIKLELTEAQHKEYRGRTEYYKIALEILECEV